MELVFRLETLGGLQPVVPVGDGQISWLRVPEDYAFFCENIREQNPARSIALSDWVQWERDGTTYCGLWKEGRIIARAAVERYSDTAWECADVRVYKEHRGQGYAKAVCHFVTASILRSGKVATCRTEEDNAAMLAVIKALGYTEGTAERQGEVTA